MVPRIHLLPKSVSGAEAEFDAETDFPIRKSKPLRLNVILESENRPVILQRVPENGKTCTYHVKTSCRWKEKMWERKRMEIHFFGEKGHLNK